MKTTLTIADGFAAHLRAGGLDRFERVMALDAAPGSVTRAVPGRFTSRVELPPAQTGGPALPVYLKRYRGRVRSAAAANEWRWLHALAAAGIPCPRPVALGEYRGLLGIAESFLITEAIGGATQADWWISTRPERKGGLIAAVASLARRFHDAGFHHQDFYLCHFFVREGAGECADGLALSIIDLQRCGLHRGRRRWLVKDLAQLHHSFREAGFTPEDWQDFLERYGGLDRALGRAVLAKSARIARHVPRYG
jgi:Ser/Thr protein kinase RdoA (MazF antagonist)